MFIHHESKYEIENHEATQPLNEHESSDDENDITPLVNNDDVGGIFKTRYVFGFMGFLGFAVVYAMRVNLSVAIVAMVNQTAISHENVTIEDVCPASSNTSENNTLPENTNGEFIWDETTQGIVLGSFFYGYVITQVPGGRLAEQMGGKLVYGFGVLITAIFTMLTPMAAYFSLPTLVVVRILEGMGEGVTYPAMHAMLAHWIPPLERNKFASVVYAGSNIGTVISLPLAGWLCSLQFMGGWPLAFYIFGILGIIWFIFWMLLVFDTPSAHPRISYKELNYIERSIRLTGVDEDFDGQIGIDSESIPWLEVLSSLPVWAILITQCGQAWAFYTQLTELPTYMNSILHFGIKSNATATALPYFTSWILGICCSIFADWLLARNYISLLNSMKLWNTIASVIPSLGLIGVAYVGCNWIWVMFMLAGVGAFQGAVYSGNQLNHIAISPKYAGTLYGLTNAAGNTCGFLAPYVIGMLINGKETLTRWRLVFYLAAFFCIGGNFFYLLFASATEQSWSKNRRRTLRETF
ncbi:sialin [Condylostylus longicornis]|uniref:sialin n=1 Tax=Condylostylus longicornis TaxID=2530218 RepID=UPI00244DBA36|nr:sialin [Condylostylus longicornis]